LIGIWILFGQKLIFGEKSLSQDSNHIEDFQYKGYDLVKNLPYTGFFTFISPIIEQIG